MRIGSAFLCILAVLVAGAFASTPALAATTYYASPTGSGSTCSESVPCAIPGAVKKAQGGDSVQLAPGTYTLTTSLLIEEPINFGGESAVDTTIEAIGADLEDYDGADATLHDFRLDTTSGLAMRSGTAERVFVDDTAALNTFACSMSAGTALLDSVCWAHGSSPGGGAVIAEDGGGVGNTVTLRNDTLVAANPEGIGILNEVESPTGALTIAATNVIASGTRRDVFAVGNGGTSKAAVVLVNSDYTTVQEVSTAAITPPGTNGGRTAPPAFIAAAGGDFVEAAGSPTVDAGLTEDANGVYALAGESRALPALCGGAPLTDIGAYELVPTCGPTPPPPQGVAPPMKPVTATPRAAPSNQIRIGKLKKHPKTGTGTLVVWVPDAGTLTLRGKGVKKVTVQSTGAAKLKLAVKPTGKAKRTLASVGKAKLKLKLSFLPAGGTVGLAGKSVNLAERLR